MYSKLKVSDSAQYTCGDAQQRSEHIIQECTNYDTLRTYWPMEMPVNVKLLGTKQELLSIIYPDRQCKLLKEDKILDYDC